MLILKNSTKNLNTCFTGADRDINLVLKSPSMSKSHALSRTLSFLGLSSSLLCPLACFLNHFLVPLLLHSHLLISSAPFSQSDLSSKILPISITLLLIFSFPLIYQLYAIHLKKTIGSRSNLFSSYCSISNSSNHPT